MKTAKTTDAQKERIARLIKEDLESYNKGFIIDPVIVKDDVDFYGDPILFVEIIFDGEGLLDPHWNNSQHRRLAPHLEEMGIDIPLIETYIGKAGWARHQERIKNGLR
ncbi:MAG: hypothetical protein F4X65_06060 [Chloroflexi bacterium]|nr:hypothetical protein [Chloroflexota bacterium]